MQKLTFKGRLSFGFSFILAFCLTFLTIVFFIFYFSFSLINRQNFMLKEANEIFGRHMIVAENELFFRRDTENKTLSSYLRDESLSSVILDSKGKIVGTYGVYATLANVTSIDSIVKSKNLDKALLDGQNSFDFYELRDNKYYLVLHHPIFDENGVVGVMVLASDLNVGKEMVYIFVATLMAILFISIITGWIFTHFVIKKQFKPLYEILQEMNSFELGKKSNIKVLLGNPQDELVRLSEAFKAMVERVNEGSKKQVEFIANASHELKTPLTNSLLTLDIAEMDLTDKKYKETKKSIRAVKNDLKNYGDLINGMLEIAKIKNASDTFQEINTRKILDEIISNQQLNENLTTEVRVENDTHIFFPENYFRVLMNNLIGNAIKYSKPKSKIIVTVKSKSGIQVSVENETTNLKQSELQSIWNRNKRLRNTDEVGGNGIGLHLVKEVTNLFGLNIVQELKKGVYKVTIKGFS